MLNKEILKESLKLFSRDKRYQISHKSVLIVAPVEVGSYLSVAHFEQGLRGLDFLINKSCEPATLVPL